MKKIAIFASGSGSNAENIVKYFKGHHTIEVAMMICDRKQAFVFERMNRLGIPSHYMHKENFNDDTVLNLLEENKIDYIVLAGFLKLVPENLIKAFPNRIINIHPALLPSYGGKGMFGMHVHNAVVDAGDSKTGITIHYVNEKFDEGEIIAQYETPLSKEDTAETVAAKIHELEMKWFPVVIDKVIG